jgi:hypothetical protein
MERRSIDSRVLIALIIVGSVFLLTAGAAVAAGSNSQGLAPVGGNNAGAALSGTYAISGTDHVTGGMWIAECISRTFEGVTASDVLALRSEGYGFGEIVKAYFLAAVPDDDLEVDDILGMREAEMGWGEIALSLGLSPSSRDRNLGQIISGRLQISGTVSMAAQQLAERLGVPPQEVAALMDEGASRGEIIVAYKLAGKLDGATPEGLIEQRLAGANWGQIKRGWTAPTTSLESTQGKPEQGNRPDHAGPPDDKGRPDHAGPPDDKGQPDHAGPKKDNGRKK